MKIILTESQLRYIISEQPESRFVPRGMSNKEHMDALGGIKLKPNLGADDYADIVSGLIDAIPGIGNLISGGIDIAHGITYIVRYFHAKTTEEKLEMAVMGLITLGTAFIPIGGNAMNVAARNQIKFLLRKTPYELRLIAKKMGLIKNAGFNLAKTAWKYSFLIALTKIFRQKLSDAIASITSTLASIGNKSKELRPYIDNFTKDIKDLQLA